MQQVVPFFFSIPNNPYPPKKCCSTHTGADIVRLGLGIFQLRRYKNLRLFFPAALKNKEAGKNKVHFLFRFYFKVRQNRLTRAF